MEETKIIQFDNMTSLEAMCILGIEDKNLKVLSECFAKKISFRDNKFIIQDCDEFVAKQIKQVLMALYELAKKNQPVTELDVTYACRLVLKSEEIHFDDFERLVVHLLIKMGYGTLQLNKNAVTQKTNDEGIDGIVTADKFGFDSVYIQAKQ